MGLDEHILNTLMLDILVMYDPKNVYQQSPDKKIVEFKTEADLLNACTNKFYNKNYIIKGTPHEYNYWIYDKKKIKDRNKIVVAPSSMKAANKVKSELIHMESDQQKFNTLSNSRQTSIYESDTRNEQDTPRIPCSSKIMRKQDEDKVKDVKTAEIETNQYPNITSKEKENTHSSRLVNVEEASKELDRDHLLNQAKHIFKQVRHYTLKEQRWNQKKFIGSLYKENPSSSINVPLEKTNCKKEVFPSFKKVKMKVIQPIMEDKQPSNFTEHDRMDPTNSK
jgi:hypothetical protein